LTVTACAFLLQAIEQKAGHKFTRSAHQQRLSDCDPLAIRLRHPFTQGRAVNLLYLVSHRLG
jgi:hypothetical protein